MSKTIIGIVSLLAILAAAPAPVSAQEPPPSPDELTLRPGDKITWSAQAPHRVRIGGTVTHNGAPLNLTPFADVEKLLDISPTLVPDANGVALAAPGATVTATVKSTATSGAEFFFSCGFPPHMGLMVTRSFKIEASAGQPTRDIEIVSANPPRWVLKTPTGDRNLNR